ncbi:MAG: hypothetical protein Q7K57_47120 [Burkholderiaceae bacterium]|nr:hypothetical protein [Burkholderiaceae bacterium]
MSEITPAAAVAGTTPPAPKLKKPRVLKPKARPGHDSFRYGLQSTGSAPAPVYGPCSFHVDIDSRSVLGEPSEAEQIRAFCNGFFDLPDLCSVKGFAIAKGTWTVSVDLASDGKDVLDPFISEMFRRLTPLFDASPVLKRDFGAGKARFRVVNVTTVVDYGPLN